MKCVKLAERLEVVARSTACDVHKAKESQP